MYGTLNTVLEQLKAIGPLLGGLAAITALTLGLTKGTRLRRREEILRLSLDVTPTVSDAYTATKLYHRATMAALVSRQVAGAWVFVWPWIAWCAICAIMANIGATTVNLMNTHPEYSFNELLTVMFGMGLPVALLWPLLPIAASAVLYVYQRSRYEDRALIAQEFFSHGTLRALRPFGAEEHAAGEINPKSAPGEKAPLDTNSAPGAPCRAMQTSEGDKKPEGDGIHTALDTKYAAIRQAIRATTSSIHRTALAARKIIENASPGIAASGASFLGGTAWAVHTLRTRNDETGVEGTVVAPEAFTTFVLLLSVAALVISLHHVFAFTWALSRRTRTFPYPP